MGIPSRMMWIAFNAIALGMLLSPVARAAPPASSISGKRIATPDIKAMLGEVYASKKPVGFEQLDVTPIVSRWLPVGLSRAQVLAAFKGIDSAHVVEQASGALIVRDDRGRAMFDPDARSILMTFRFDGAGMLTGVQAIHMKNQ